ncbi:TetR/AcrR family transcriptional regulator [Agromyces aerolatus]|uniref:TetR/AcrR family transcriptional regulator n=1 Tax=Agromyces sp. LY-1074 TaxID=3074080 RepID=UPI00285F9B34|nr:MULTISPECIES: helix-turn-helix domain-containing protein [unclassified Agromyces]MDR5701879.1 helix-turn-helix domain-containing protein [Agromyces sp. LY-1074]MDR5708107.1 helix-turn-helix domain-containing protein [Agromyces sp. LY-1358]
MADTMTPGARRVLDAAADLFYERGIHAVGVDTIAAAAGVTKKTLYDRFGSKDALVVAYLRERDERWRMLLEERLRRSTAAPAERILLVFDAAEDWMTARGSRGCSAINARAEVPDPEHPIAVEVSRQKAGLLEVLHSLATEAGVADAGQLARMLLLVLDGAFASTGVQTMASPFSTARAAAAILVAAAG